MADNVNHPAHYTQGTVECIDAIESAVAGKIGAEAVLVAQVIKYLWRLEAKGNKLQDAQKAHWYLSRLIDKLERDEAQEKAESFAGSLAEQEPF